MYDRDYKFIRLTHQNWIGLNHCASVTGFSSPCMPNPCINDGFCAEDKANEKGYLCICKQGFAGNQCQSKATMLFF